jgi:hypothetical protein
MTTRNRELAGIIDDSGNITAGGNLTVSGTTLTSSSTVETHADPLIELNTGAGSNSNDLGFVFERGSTGDNACIIWDESNDGFAVGTTSATGTSTGNMTFTTADFAAGKITVDNVLINGTTIGHTSDTDLLTFADGVLTVAGEISVTTLDIGGTNVTATAAELNILDGVNSTAAELNILDGVTATAAEINFLDGDTSATGTTLAAADRVIVNDGGTMKQVALSDFETFFESEIDTFSTIDINGGSIDGATVGANSASSGAFTTLSASGALTGTLGTAAQTNITSLGTLTGLTVQKASSGASATSGTVVTIEDDDNTELSLLGGSSSLLAINFGHSGDNDEGKITFNTTAGSEDLQIVSSKEITLDAAGDIILDAGGQNWYFDDDGTRVFSIAQVSSDVYIGTEVADKDMIFRVNDSDGGGVITALTLDASAAGQANFNSHVFAGGLVDVATVGQLANVATDLTIYSSASGHNGLRFHVNGILPTNNSGAIVDNDADLGDPSYRFKDLHLSHDLKLTSGSEIYFGERGNIKHDDSAYNMIFNTNSQSTALVVAGTGEIGVGVIPETDWHSDWYALQVGAGTLSTLTTGAQLSLAQNARATTGSSNSGWKYINTAAVAQYVQDAGNHYFKYAASGSADAGITWTQAMTIKNNGNIVMGSGNEGGKLNVNGTSYFNNTMHMASAGNIQWTGGAYWTLNSTNSDTDFILMTGNNSTERARFSDDGSFGVGVSPRNDMHFSSGTGTSGEYWGFGGGQSNTVFYVIDEDNAGAYISHGGSSWQSHSDERIKENIVSLGTVLPDLKNMRCVTYNRKGNTDTKIGFIAQDWESKFPEVVDEDDGFVIDSGGLVVKPDESSSTDNIKSISYTETIPVLLKAIQELEEKLNIREGELEQRIHDLEQRLV